MGEEREAYAVPEEGGKPTCLPKKAGLNLFRTGKEGAKKV